jgi:hypothetical protein
MSRTETRQPHRMAELCGQANPLGQQLQVHPARVPDQPRPLGHHGDIVQPSSILVHGSGAPTL